MILQVTVGQLKRFMIDNWKFLDGWDICGVERKSRSLTSNPWDILFVYSLLPFLYYEDSRFLGAMSLALLSWWWITCEGMMASDLSGFICSKLQRWCNMVDCSLSLSLCGWYALLIHSCFWARISSSLVHWLSVSSLLSFISPCSPCIFDSRFQLLADAW